MSDYPIYVPPALLAQASDRLLEPVAGRGWSSLLRFLGNRGYPIIDMRQVEDERVRRGMRRVPARPYNDTKKGRGRNGS